MALVLEDVTVRFQSERGTLTAIEGLSAEIPEGGFASLIGPSGCGKSTLLRVVADLVTPTAGSVTVFGGTPATARSCRLISFVFQDATLLPWRTALQNVCLPLDVGPKSTRGRLQRTPEELLELVGLSGREHAMPSELSGGMRQRVAIARALVCEPSVLLMDEPFSALDAMTREALQILALELGIARGLSAILITHDIREAVMLGNRILVMGATPNDPMAIIDNPGAGKPDFPESVEFLEQARSVRARLYTTESSEPA